ncbi:hypothetical protein CJ030_MR4G017903 [Morella rubra]|uniref:Uncharacterized protein n=1 Tax=Morella rubra TaxID=262757 RepID=A0A6A1VRN8_9ROSI|nr:hypothetical protein CJ030_MR4G017909 [Morella rubra]KAB1215569.1 hypothetical protein CJ030_MR4G017903 [Morella rubra]
MGLMRKELVCLSLLLLVLLLLETPSSADGAAAFGTFKTGSPPSTSSNAKPNGAFGRHKDEDGDVVFGDDKRKVYTGPNPLHN